MRVEAIDKKLTRPFILSIHYAFGLSDGEELIGVCTYGSPPAAEVQKGMVGTDFPFKFLELNRLCLLHNRKNEASMLVSRSLALLPKPVFVMSFADSSRGHFGTVYQAANAVYVGLSSKRFDWALHSQPNLHSRSLSARFKGKGASARIREQYGDDFYLRPRSMKHRYVWLLGCKQERRAMRALLKPEPQPYPKPPYWMT